MSHRDSGYRSNPSLLLMIVGLLVLAVVANSGLEALRKRLEPVRAATARELLGTLADQDGTGAFTRALAQISYEFRRVAADILWFKLDKYVHEGPVMIDSKGQRSVGYFNNLDIVPLYRLITWLDPHFVDAYRLAGTHILNTLNRPDEAVRMWKEGVANNRGNPRRKELLGELAVYYIRDRKEFASARQALEEAERCLAAQPRYEEEALDVFHPETIRGMLILACYYGGDVDAALAYSRGEHNLGADHPVMRALSRVQEVPLHQIGPIRRPCGHESCDGVHRAGRGDRAATDHGPEPLAPQQDVHQRPWMEAWRLSRIRQSLVFLAVVLLVILVLRQGLRALRRPEEKRPEEKRPDAPSSCGQPTSHGLQ